MRTRDCDCGLLDLDAFGRYVRFDPSGRARHQAGCLAFTSDMAGGDAMAQLNDAQLEHLRGLVLPTRLRWLDQHGYRAGEQAAGAPPKGFTGWLEAVLAGVDWGSSTWHPSVLRAARQELERERSAGRSIEATRRAEVAERERDEARALAKLRGDEAHKRAWELAGNLVDDARRERDDARRERDEARREAREFSWAWPYHGASSGRTPDALTDNPKSKD